MINRRRDPKLHWKNDHAYAVFADSTRDPKRKWYSSGITDNEAAGEWFTDVKRAWRRGDLDPWREKSRRELSVEKAITKYFMAHTHLQASTVNTRRSVLECFSRSIAKGITLDLVDSSHVIAFLNLPNRRTKRPLGLETQHGYLTILRYFFGWCKHEGLSRANPAHGVKLPKLGRKVPDFMTPMVFRRFMTTIDALYEAKRNRPDKRYRIGENDLIWIREPIQLGLATGLRISDIVRLTWNRVQLETGVIRVDDRTKTGNEYLVPILSLAREVLERQLEKGPCNLETSHDLVFQAQPPYSGPISKGNLQSLIREVRTYARLPSNISFHTLRHTFATWMLMQTNNIRLVSALLGHTNLEQTQRYAHVALLAMRQINHSDFEALGMSWHHWLGQGAGNTKPFSSWNWPHI